MRPEHPAPPPAEKPYDAAEKALPYDAAEETPPAEELPAAEEVPAESEAVGQTDVTGSLTTMLADPIVL